MFFSSTWDFPIETIEIIQTTDGQSRHKKEWQAVHFGFPQGGAPEHRRTCRHLGKKRRSQIGVTVGAGGKSL